jgi:hypothetical protein
MKGTKDPKMSKSQKEHQHMMRAETIGMQERPKWEDVFGISPSAPAGKLKITGIFSSNRFRTIGIILPLIAVAIIGAFWHVSKISFNENKSEVNLGADALVSELVEKVGKHVVLPKEETPVVGVVEDVERLATAQPFYYQDAKNGDKVLIYSVAQKLIVYSETDDKIVSMGPLLLEKKK